MTEPVKPALIKTERLIKRFGDITAVNGISLSVARGEVLGFLGPNGAGKSTTMKMITGFLEPDEGTRADWWHRYGASVRWKRNGGSDICQRARQPTAT